jgi:hypothetical protein
MVAINPILIIVNGTRGKILQPSPTYRARNGSEAIFCPNNGELAAEWRNAPLTN